MRPLAAVNRSHLSAGPWQETPALRVWHMPVPDLDATVRSLYRAATGEATWDAVLAPLRDGLGAQALEVVTGAASAAAGHHLVRLVAPSAGGAPAVHITWPADRPPDAATRAWLDRLAPHLHDALRAGWRLRQLPQRVTLGRVLLDRLPQPAWLLQADGRMAWENAPGRQARAAGGWLHADGPHLHPRHPGRQRVLAAALASALAEPTGRRLLVPVEPAPADATAVPPRRAHWLVRRLDRMPSAGPLAAGDDAVLLVVLFDPAQADAGPVTAPQQVAALSAVYGFTPAESRVALHLARGSTVRAIAATLDVAPSTVRSHLDAVNAKLGVDRKLDAVRLLVQGGWLWRRGQQEGTLDA